MIDITDLSEELYPLNYPNAVYSIVRRPMWDQSPVLHVELVQVSGEESFHSVVHFDKYYPEGKRVLFDGGKTGAIAFMEQQRHRLRKDKGVIYGGRGTRLDFSKKWFRQEHGRKNGQKEFREFRNGESPNNREIRNSEAAMARKARAELAERELLNEVRDLQAIPYFGMFS